MQFPFEVDFGEIQSDPDPFVDAIFDCLESDFLVMPKDEAFVEFATFEAGYEALKRATRNFHDMIPEKVEAVVFEVPVSLIVLRCMLGFSPPEWAYYASRQTNRQISQGAARNIDRRIRINPNTSLLRSTTTTQRHIRALIAAACHVLEAGASAVPPNKLHRLEKADTRAGLDSLRSLAQLGVPYSMLLYERFLGRPFASHRDSVSEIVGNSVENAIEETLSHAGISYRKTKRAESLPGFDQAPDFLIPSEFNPQVVIEAKVAEDDGTARDKITRVQHLDTLSMRGQPEDQPKFEVIACIAGRGFGVRRTDMEKLLLATRGKVFTLQNMEQLVTHTRLAEFRSQ